MQRPRYPPNPPLGGLPSGPRARPAGVTTNSNTTESTYPHQPSYDAPSTVGPSRSLRQQRSFTSLSAQSGRGSIDTSRPPLPPAPASLRSRSAARPSRAATEDEGRQSRNSAASSSSVSSSSSTGSSLMERMRVRSRDTTPRTSLDEDDESKREWARIQAGGRREDKYNDDGDSPQKEELVVPAAGSSIWDRLTSAAGNLTVSVGQAWATNVSLQSGEETPPGSESRLTRAMKAYHLQQARSPADLPDWLFEPHERGVRGASAPTRRSADESLTETSSPPPPSRGFRDIYVSSTAPAPAASRSRFDDVSQSSTATNRLKALRDAKRQASGVVTGREPMADASRARAQEEYRPPASARRVGLPMGPAARRVGTVAA